MPETTLAAVGCSSSKYEDDEPLPARDRYASGYWTCKERYGSVVTDDWRIISAEHAVLHPDAEIDYYERTPGDLKGVPVTSDDTLPDGDPVETALDQCAADVHAQLAAWLEQVTESDPGHDVELQVLLGRKYRTPLESRDVFDALSIPGNLQVTFPFQEEPQAQGGNGQQMGWMTDRVEAREE